MNDGNKNNLTRFLMKNNFFDGFLKIIIKKPKQKFTGLIL